jgi:hypothetical protein
MNTQREIAHRLRRRAAQVLRPLGRWERCRGLIRWESIAAELARRIPGDLADLDLDHVRPLSSYDLTRDAEVADAFSAANLQWLRAGTNRRKGARSYAAAGVR